MKRVLLTIIGVLVAAPLLLAQDNAKVAAGKAAFAAQKCSVCHQVGGQGGKMAASLDGVGKKLAEADIRKWLTSTAEMEAKLPAKPKASMAAAMKSKKLTDTDIDGLVAYLMSLK